MLWKSPDTRQVRLGLEAGLPVDEYRQMRFSATDMKSKLLESFRHCKEELEKLADRNILDLN